MAFRHKDTISFWILRPFERLPYFPYLLNRGFAHVAERASTLRLSKFVKKAPKRKSPQRGCLLILLIGFRLEAVH